MRTRARVYGSAAVVTVVLAIAAAGCATKTTVTEVWTGAAAPGPMRSVLVIGARADQATRHKIEDAFAANLALHGVRATPSYALFHDTFPASEEAQNIVKQVGFDGLLVATSKGTTEKATVVIDSADFWHGYYGKGWGGWYAGYVYTDQFVKFETTVWDQRAGGKLVFAALTQTKNPSSGRDFVQSLTKAVLPDADARGPGAAPGLPRAHLAAQRGFSSALAVAASMAASFASTTGRATGSALARPVRSARASSFQSATAPAAARHTPLPYAAPGPSLRSRSRCTHAERSGRSAGRQVTAHRRRASRTCRTLPAARPPSRARASRPRPRPPGRGPAAGASVRHPRRDGEAKGVRAVAPRHRHRSDPPVGVGHEVARDGRARRRSRPRRPTPGPGRSS